MVARLAVGLLVLAGLLGTGFALGHWAAPPENPCTAFDAERWNAVRSERQDLDAQYRVLRPQAKHLEQCPALLRGRSRAGVRELLGRPNNRFHQDRTWSYTVGVPEGQSDFGTLMVTFGADGRWSKTELRQAG